MIHIAQFGTYDIESFGDAMFPKMFSYGMKSFSDCKIDLFSLKSVETSYSANDRIHAYDEFEIIHKQNPFNLVVIGGGEFIHYNPIVFKETNYPKGYLWKKPIDMANSLGIPIIINCVGVSEDFDDNQKREARDYFSKVNHIALRDRYSYGKVARTGVDKQKLSCKPDNNWLFSMAYPESELNKWRRILEKKLKSYSADEDYIVVQYGTSKDIGVLAEQIVRIQELLKLRVYLMPVNYCHFDLEYLQQLKSIVKDKAILIDEHLEPLDMMAIISGAKLFMGTSLHGNLTAMSYGVRAIGLDMYPNIVGKMEGIFDMVGNLKYLIPNVIGLVGAVNDIFQDDSIIKTTNERVSSLQNELIDYFSGVAKEFDRK